MFDICRIHWGELFENIKLYEERQLLQKKAKAMCNFTCNILGLVLMSQKICCDVTIRIGESMYVGQTRGKKFWHISFFIAFLNSLGQE